MNRVKILRERTKLSAQKFGDLYGIPLRTIQDWEREVRAAPEYVINLLERAVNEDFPRTWKRYDSGSVNDVLNVERQDNFPGHFTNYKEVAEALNRGYGYVKGDECFYSEEDVIVEHQAGYLWIYEDGAKMTAL